MTEWRIARAGFDAREEALQAELAAIPTPRSTVDIATARKLWFDDPDGDLPLDERRAFLRLFIAKITVSRAKAGTRKFDHSRVNIDYLWVDGRG